MYNFRRQLHNKLGKVLSGDMSEISDDGPNIILCLYYFVTNCPNVKAC